MTVVPARLALALCGAFGKEDKEDFKVQAMKLAEYFAQTGHEDLQLYVLAQIGQTPVFETE